MPLKEILGLEPVKSAWNLNKDMAIFDLDDQKFGIHIDESDLSLPDRTLNVANISYGRIKNKFENQNDLDLSLVNGTKPRTILSSVATALANNDKLLSFDMIALAASDQVKTKRYLIYSLAVQEIKKENPKFKQYEIVNATSSNGSKIIILSKIILTDIEKRIIVDELGISK